ncbi:MAG: hypothetical protein JW699_07055 [Chitinispirillaceae bacterium]|nr:hypothetical protein [Chitinispirillaceae bacterium]
MDRRLLYFCVFAAGAVLSAGTFCKKNPAGPGGDDGPPPQIYGYTSTDTTIRVSIPAHVDTAAYCVIDSLMFDIDAVPATVLAFSYVISGTTLTLVHGVDSAVYTRVGSGSGLVGTWTRGFTGDGLPSDLIFAAATVTLEYNLCHADGFITYDWAPDSAAYAVTLTRVSCTEVRLSGDYTGETVTITWNDWNDMTTSGTGAGHAPHTWRANPVSCPNDYFPDWYYTGFLNDNFIE